MKRIIALAAYVVIVTIGCVIAELFFESDWNKVFIMFYGFLVFSLGFGTQSFINTIKL